jgi:hypothetical protein
MTTHDHEPHDHDSAPEDAMQDMMNPERVRTRAEHLSMLLASDETVDALTRDSAAAMRPAVLAAAARAQRARRRARRMYAAAAIVIIAGIGFVPPARAWVVEQARSVATALGVLRTEPAPEPPSPVATPPGDADVRFTFAVRTTTAVIEFGASRGTLVVRRGGGPDASAESIGAPGARFVVLPNGVRIHGEASATARYIVTLPPLVREVRIVRPDGSVSVHPVAEMELEIGGRR